MINIFQNKLKNNLKILYIINSLELGGAEQIFFNILKNKKNILIITLISEGYFGNKLKKKGFKLINLNMKKNIFIIFKMFKLIQIIKRYNPEIVHTWLYHSNLIGGIASKLSGVKQIFWSIHHEFEYSNIFMFIEMKILALLSYLIPNKIVYCTYSSKRSHIQNGYKQNLSYIVENGISLEKFKPKKELRINIRKKLKIKKNCFLIGNISRFHPIKDHETLLKSLIIFKKSKISFKCILIGNGLSKCNVNLFNKIKNYNLENNVILYGKSFKVHELLNAFDLNILSSKSECSPVTLLEAMASGVPSLSTNVGNAKNLIGNSGWIVETENPEALASCISYIANNRYKLAEKSKLGIKRVRSFYTIEKMRLSYRALYT